MTLDLLITNANVLTMNPLQPEASAIGIQGDRISWVGSMEDAHAHLPMAQRTMDLGGATLLPGFIEAHNHLMLLGHWLSQIDCSYPSVTTIEDILRAVEDRVTTTPADTWIEGRGYDDNKLDGHRQLTRWDLDRVAPHHPVSIRHASGHMSVVNSAALQLGGISRSTDDPPGGHIMREEHGELTGLLQEAAQSLLPLQFIPDDPDTLRECMMRAGAAYRAAGVTSAQEAGIFSTPEFTVYQDAWQARELPLRTYLMIRTNFIDALEQLGLHTGFGDDWLRIGSLKIMSDGSLIGRTAAVSEPFLNDPTDDNLGLMMLPDDALDDLIWRGHRRGWQVAIHAIGDRAIELCLNGFERAQHRLPRDDARHRLEHCGILRPDLIDRMKQLGVVAVPQPPFIREFGDGFLRHLGPQRSQLTYAMKTLLERGIPVAGSSDSPVSSYQPLIGIQTAVLETTASGEPFAPAEALSIDEALALYTRAGAFASFDEKNKGQIAPQMLADFVVLQDDPRHVEPSTIDQIPVLATLIGGDVVYERELAAVAAHLA
jgi:predicted amidohydrolase YtcJ